jgi:hypothetical protein
MNQRNQTILLMVGMAVALILLAAGLHDLSLRPGRPLDLELLWSPSVGTGSRQRVDLPPWLPLVSAITLVVAAIAMIVSPSLRRDIMRNLPIYLMLLFGVYLMREATSQTPRVEQASGIVEQAAPQVGEAYPPPAAPDFIANPPEWLVGAISIGLVLGIVALAYLVLKRKRKVAAKDTLSELVDEVQEVLVDLRRGADLRDTISRCYSEMVRVIQTERGVARELSMTPREFEARLAASGLAANHIRRLTRLFERVRYGQQALGAAEEQEALACLDAIVEAYRIGRTSI